MKNFENFGEEAVQNDQVALVVIWIVHSWQGPVGIGECLKQSKTRGNEEVKGRRKNWLVKWN